MSVNRAEIVDQNFIRFLQEAELFPVREDLSNPVRENFRLTGRQALDLLDSQITARHLDLIARKLKAENKAFYTIGSAGHEGNAALGLCLRKDDMGFLHYRSGAFLAQHAKKIPGESQIYNVLLSLAASSEDPVSGGRHKVFGSVELNIPPQTSTIASQLPKAVGAAFALERAKRLGISTCLSLDSIIYCSFGDASLNHSVAQGAINSAQWSLHQNLPLPMLFICEDNGLGISVHTPEGWVEASMANRKGIHYVPANGLDMVEAHEAALNAVDYCRQQRRPVFLHLKTVRLLGHAGSDVDLEYLGLAGVEAAEARDPLIASAKICLQAGLLAPEEILKLYESIRARVEAVAAEAVRRPKLCSAAEVMKPLAPHHPDEVKAEARRKDFQDRREQIWGGADKLPEKNNRPKHLAVIQNQGLRDILAQYPDSFIFGEDVAKKGGVYNVTSGLWECAGTRRVFNTLLDETTILGIAQGFSHLGMMPIPEIQYLAYYHNAEDQIRGEAASLQYFSNGQFRNPMVIRIASFGYQKGFGGHFHNDNSIAALRDVPGIVIAAPARGADAVQMFRTAMALAKVDGRVVFFLEPIALYMTRDLHAPNDGLWQDAYPAPGSAIDLGEGRVYGEDAKDLTIISYANGLHLSLQAQKILAEIHGVKARVLDLRWLAPLNFELILAEAKATGNVLVVDECRRTGSLSEEIICRLAESGEKLKLRRVNGEDCYIPLGSAANLMLPSAQSIVHEALETLK